MATRCMVGVASCIALISVFGGYIFPLSSPSKAAEKFHPSERMRAWMYSEYGEPKDVLQLRTVPRPLAGPKEVIVKVKATSVNAGDVHLITGKPYIIRLMAGLSPSGVVGYDLAGVVFEIGENVTELAVGDGVYGQAREFGGIGDSGFAEFAVVPVENLVRKPDSISFEEAASVPVAGATAFEALHNDLNVTALDKRVLINGASGGVGTYSVQIAKALGAQHVTAVCSGPKADISRNLGADAVIDYNKRDFTVLEQGEDLYDAIADLVTNHPLSHIKRILTDKGRFVSMSKKPMGNWFGIFAHMFNILYAHTTGPQSFGMCMSLPKRENLLALNELVEKGKVRPVIDRKYSFLEIPDALEYLQEGHASGKVVVSMTGKGK